MPVVVAVKGEGIGAQRGIEWDDLCLCILALSVSLRIGELIFMEIDERRQLSEGGNSLSLLFSAVKIVFNTLISSAFSILINWF